MFYIKESFHTFLFCTKFQGSFFLVDQTNINGSSFDQRIGVLNLTLCFTSLFVAFKTMDLLDSILRKAKAESLTEKFKENGIEASTLSLLTDKDLQLLGIEKPEKRQDILKCIANLQIPKEYAALPQRN